MVDDSLQFKDNFVGYTTAPEYSLEFINNQALWDKKNVAELVKERNMIYAAMQNTHKDLNFLHQNRLIFMFQNNIVKMRNLQNIENGLILRRKPRIKRIALPISLFLRRRIFLKI